MIERILVFILVVATGVYGIAALIFRIGLFRPRRGRIPEQPSVSVVIAARNEEDGIAGCLADLTHQTYPQDRYEVIIVNDGSSDRTAEVVETLAGEQRNVRLLRAPDPRERGLSPKKNALDTGIRHATGEIILTTDADCRVPPTWIEEMVRYFEPDVGVVIGFSQIGKPVKCGMRDEEKRSLFERLQAFDFLALMSAAAGSANVGIPLAASGQNFAYRRRVFEEVGGFSQIGHRISGDDVLFLQLVRRQTVWRAIFAGSHGTFVTTTGQKTFRGFIEQRKRWASNGSYQYRLNKPFFAYITAVFVMNFLLLTLVPYSLIGYRLQVTGCRLEAIPISCLVMKIVADLVVTLRGTMLFGRRDLLGVFPFWTILQIPYIVATGIVGTIGQFTWKGRKHEQRSKEDTGTR